MNDYQPNQLLNPEKVSELLGVTIQTLAIWRCSKRYPLTYVKVGRYVRYRYSDVLAFLAKRTIGE
jgi:predicted site-specific integrase-resolvase